MEQVMEYVIEQVIGQVTLKARVHLTFEKGPG